MIAFRFGLEGFAKDKLQKGIPHPTRVWHIPDFLMYFKCRDHQQAGRTLTRQYILNKILHGIVLTGGFPS